MSFAFRIMNAIIGFRSLGNQISPTFLFLLMSLPGLLTMQFAFECPLIDPLSQSGPGRSVPLLPDPGDALFKGSSRHWERCAIKAVKDSFGMMYTKVNPHQSPKDMSESLASLRFPRPTHIHLKDWDWVHGKFTLKKPTNALGSGRYGSVVSGSWKTPSVHPKFAVKLISKKSKYMTARDVEDEMITHIRAYAAAPSAVARPLDIVLEATGSWMLIMEKFKYSLLDLFFDGTELPGYNKEHKPFTPFPEEYTVRIILPFFYELAKLEAQGIQHRDLKMDNIMISLPKGALYRQKR
ncbi:hypothetical protein BJ684DRAFT_16416, partial [Piptocephalis cylindrospora]